MKDAVMTARLEKHAAGWEEDGRAVETASANGAPPYQPGAAPQEWIAPKWTRAGGPIHGPGLQPSIYDGIMKPGALPRAGMEWTVGP